MMDYCPIRARSVCEAVEEHTRSYEERTKLVVAHKVEEFHWTDFHVGPLLGSGSFSSVYQIKMENGYNYALKILKKKVMESEKDFESGAIDLVMESKLLQRLNHPNIIKLCGIKGGSISESFMETGFFLVLERLHGTLDQNLRAWRQMKKKRTTSTGSVPTLAQRLQTIALGIASAMEYLHSLSVCYRDLKPQNVAFDAKGEVRLFDFGFAEELTTRETADGENVSRRVGTARYMAPEMALCQPYGLSSDVYSFGLILWEICTMKQAFKDLSFSEHTEFVLGKGRPPLKDLASSKSGSISPELFALIQDCWHHDAQHRPTFSSVCQVLKKEQHSSYYKNSQGFGNCTKGIASLALDQLPEDSDFSISTSSGSASRRRARALISCILPFSERDEIVNSSFPSDAPVDIELGDNGTSLTAYPPTPVPQDQQRPDSRNGVSRALSMFSRPATPTQGPSLKEEQHSTRQDSSESRRSRRQPGRLYESSQDEDEFTPSDMSEWTQSARQTGRLYESSSREASNESHGRFDAVESRRVLGMTTDQNGRSALERVEIFQPMSEDTDGTRYVEPPSRKPAKSSSVSRAWQVRRKRAVSLGERTSKVSSRDRERALSLGEERTKRSNFFH